MARWKLMTAHYLVIEADNKWEYQETDRKTGRPRRIQLSVPALLDPNDPQCWTNRWGNKDNEEGEIVVCQGKGEANDVRFVGDPTPDMVPVDEEAKEISASFAKRWSYRPDAEISYSQSLIDRFEEQMATVQAKPAEVPGLSELVAAMAEQTKVISSLVTRRV